MERERDEEEEKSGGSLMGWLAAGAVLFSGAAAYLVHEEGKKTEMLGVRDRTFNCTKKSGKCAVYLDQLAVSSLPCGDQFHSACILTWLVSKSVCPTCLREVRSDDITKIRNHLASSSGSNR